MKFEVTQDHIDRGEPGDHCNCPIALAIKEQLPDRLVDVSYDYIMIGEKQYTIPLQCQRFISGFDGRMEVGRSFDGPKYVKPFSFTIEAI